MELYKDNVYFELEQNSKWDKDKKDIIEKENDSFNLNIEGDSLLLAGIWYKFFDENKNIIGYGWINTNDSEAEVSICLKNEYRGNKYSYIILDKLEEEVKCMGYNIIVANIKYENKNKYVIRHILENKSYCVCDESAEGLSKVLGYSQEKFNSIVEENFKNNKNITYKKNIS